MVPAYNKRQQCLTRPLLTGAPSSVVSRLGGLTTLTAFLPSYLTDQRMRPHVPLPADVPSDALSRLTGLATLTLSGAFGGRDFGAGWETKLECLRCGAEQAVGAAIDLGSAAQRPRLGQGEQAGVPYAAGWVETALQAE